MLFLLALSPLLADRALAQAAPATLPGGFDAHGFQLAAHDGDLRDPLVVQRPGPFTQGDFFFGGLVEYAKAPLVLVQTPSGGGESVTTNAVDNLLALNISAGVAVHDHIRLDVRAPVYGLSTDQTLTTQGPALGDVRLSAMLVGIRPVNVVGGGGFGLGLVPYLDLPSGDESRFLGSSGVAGGARVAATYEFSGATLSADIGGQINPNTADLANVQGADNLVAALGIGALASDTLGFTLEAVAMPPLQQTDFAIGGTAFPAEALLSLRYKSPSGAYWTFGGAGGLTDGPGVAAFRVFVGGGFAKQEPPRPADFDPIGELQTTDLCPLEPETTNGWKDDDGCPDRLGSLAIDVRYNGAPRGADATLEGPDGRQQQHIGPQGMSFDAVPGSLWTVKAADGCLAGESSATVGENGARISVELLPVLDASVLIEVVGLEDQPLPEATVTWVSDHPECAPGGTMQVNATGLLPQRIATGTHRVAVTAPGFNTHEEEIAFVRGDDKVIKVKLGPTLIKVEKNQIKILEKVQFETAKAIIRPESFKLLDEVAAVIVTNPDLGRVEVAGHTDNRGGDTYNLDLSQKRADSVKKYLAEHGVDEQRLVSVGYGETKPIDTNKTEQGREVNRRVEFNLIDVKDDEPAPDAPQGGTP